MLGIPDAYVGYAAGLTTSVLWTGTSLLFTAASRRLGPTVTNAVRIVFATILLAVTHRLLSGTWIPNAATGQIVLLALSGLVGLSLGDQALFIAFVRIGPRLAMLIETAAPLFAALLGWLVLGETISPIAWLGIACTVTGVAWVVLERPEQQAEAPRGHRLSGIILAFVAAACQAGGLLLSKQGMGYGWLPKERWLDPQTATFVRLFFAAIGMVPIMGVWWLRQGRRQTASAPAIPRGSRGTGVLFAFAGAVGGPYLGVWLSLVAARHAPLGVAQTLMALPPVLILPLVWLIHKERVSLRAAIGALVAVGGVALLFVQA